MKIMNYEETLTFKKDFKKLHKKFRTLSKDLEVAKRNAIELYHIKRHDNQSVFFIPRFCSERIQICKLKKFACRSLKGRGVKSGIRIIYAFFPKKTRVVFIEIYFKGDKQNEDQSRIKEYLKFLTS
ncbi:MAG: hypothetical protein ACKKMW_01230 [Candidatus Nealsonbacteria bacterium]